MLLVSFEPPERIAWYLEHVDFQWPVLSDPARDAYRAYALERASFARAWLSPRTLAFYGRQLLRARVPRKPAADSLQLGGDFLIDSECIVRLAHPSTEPADRPRIEDLIAAAGSLTHRTAP